MIFSVIFLFSLWSKKLTILMKYFPSSILHTIVNHHHHIPRRWIISVIAPEKMSHAPDYSWLHHPGNPLQQQDQQLACASNSRNIQSTWCSPQPQYYAILPEAIHSTTWCKLQPQYDAIYPVYKKSSRSTKSDLSSLQSSTQPELELKS